MQSQTLNNRLVPIVASLCRAPRRLGIALLRGYQHLISPLLPVIFGPGCGCRFYPSCSHYSVGAIERFGLLRGSLLTIGRLLRCQPWSAGGHDPVPEKAVFFKRFHRVRAPKPFVYRSHG